MFFVWEFPNCFEIDLSIAKTLLESFVFAMTRCHQHRKNNCSLKTSLVGMIHVHSPSSQVTPVLPGWHSHRDPEVVLWQVAPAAHGFGSQKLPAVETLVFLTLRVNSHLRFFWAWTIVWTVHIIIACIVPSGCIHTCPSPNYSNSNATHHYVNISCSNSHLKSQMWIDPKTKLRSWSPVGDRKFMTDGHPI